MVARSPSSDSHNQRLVGRASEPRTVFIENRMCMLPNWTKIKRVKELFDWMVDAAPCIGLTTKCRSGDHYRAISSLRVQLSELKNFILQISNGWEGSEANHD